MEGEDRTKLVEDLLKHKCPALLPFLPLAWGGATRELVEQMMAALAKEPRQEIALEGFLMATLAFKHYNEADLEWLQRRYPNMRDILQETPGYQWIISEIRDDARAEGRTEGRMEGHVEGAIEEARRSVLLAVQARIPLHLPLAERRVALITNLERLRQLTIQIWTTQDAEQALQHLGDSPLDQLS